MTVCKLDHSADGLPQWLCRVCHPELVPTPQQIADAEERERAQRKADVEALARKRELDDAERKLAGLRKRSPDAGSVSGKVAAGLERKIERIKSGGPSKLRRRHHISSNGKQSPLRRKRNVRP